MLTRLQTWRGLWRSLIIYRAPWRLRRLARFYAPWVGAGDLCFDVGAHVGNHSEALLRLGARVVALEPQPRLAAWLQHRYRGRAGLTLLPYAVGAQPGSAELRVSRRTPTVSSVSGDWIEQVRGDAGFDGVTWEETVTVPRTTLDQLIADHGVPVFCKIDVEGYEPQVLAGLSRPLPLLAFEYLPAAREAALACLERLATLGDYRFNWSEAERQRLESAAWLTAGVLADRLRDIPAGSRSGDVYARLESP